MKKNISVLFTILFFTIACNNKIEKEEKAPVVNTAVPIINYEIINTYPHDTNSFTEGLLIHDGKLFESTGATSPLPQTRSLFGIVDLQTGKIDVKAELDKTKYFGEGIVILNSKIYQLTYQTKIGFIYDARTYKKIGEFTFPSKEGWGFTTDGTYLIMSDGTNELTYLEPDNLNKVKSISVSENGYALDYLNELEYINGFIYANLWGKNTIVKIDTASGAVISKMDLTSLTEEAKQISAGSKELNGIAYDAVNKKVFVTGKMWPKIYELKFSY
jgi:glutamine cyclotransferase